jgi:hypothetical protein
MAIDKNPSVTDKKELLIIGEVIFKALVEVYCR